MPSAAQRALGGQEQESHAAKPCEACRTVQALPLPGLRSSRRPIKVTREALKRDHSKPQVQYLRDARIVHRDLKHLGLGWISLLRAFRMAEF